MFDDKVSLRKVTSWFFAWRAVMMGIILFVGGYCWMIQEGLPRLDEASIKGYAWFLDVPEEDRRTVDTVIDIARCFLGNQQ